jgi:hypothetical protein
MLHLKSLTSTFKSTSKYFIRTYKTKDPNKIIYPVKSRDTRTDVGADEIWIEPEKEMKIMKTNLRTNLVTNNNIF